MKDSASSEDENILQTNLLKQEKSDLQALEETATTDTHGKKEKW